MKKYTSNRRNRFLGRALVEKLAIKNNVIIFDNDSRGSIKKLGL